MHLCLSGASGLVGSELMNRLISREHDVTQLVRSAPGTGQVQWNPVKGQLQLADLEGTDGFIHLSGENIAEGRWNDAKKSRILESRVQSTRLLAEAAAMLDPKPSVFVCASAIGFYGDRGDEVLTEESAPGEGFLADVCQKWEEATRPATDAGIRVVNLRIGVVLSKKGGALAKILPIFRMGGGGVVGNGRQYWSWVGLEELTAMLEYCAVSDQLTGPVNGVTGSCTNHEFTKTLGRVLGRPTLFPLPGFMAKIMLGEMAEHLLLASTRVEPTKLQAAQYPFLDADLESAFRRAIA